MKQSIEIRCPHCGHDDPVKNGHSKNGTQRYRCRGCRRRFQWEDTDHAWKPEVKAQITELILNGTGVRAMSRTLNIAKDTVIAELKKNSSRGECGVCDRVKSSSRAGAGRDTRR